MNIEEKIDACRLEVNGEPASPTGRMIRLLELLVSEIHKLVELENARASLDVEKLRKKKGGKNDRKNA